MRVVRQTDVREVKIKSAGSKASAWCRKRFGIDIYGLGKVSTCKNVGESEADGRISRVLVEYDDVPAVGK
jgi:hypothetical protein